METLFANYKLPVKSNATERGELLKSFLEPLNINRADNKFKPMSIARVGQLLAHIPTKDLYYLLSVCTDSAKRSTRYYESFSKRFYFELRPQNDQKI